MIKEIDLNQVIPARQKIIVGLPIIGFGFLVFDENMIVGILCFLFGLFVFSINYSLVITKDFSNYYQIRSLTFPLFKIKKDLFFPDYVSLFLQSFVQSNNVGFSPKILGDSRYELFTIKFFENNKNVIIFTSSNKDEVMRLGQELSTMLNVELYNILE